MSVLFISDLHLSSERPDKTALFYKFLKRARHDAEALYILGDLFEIWLGDDDDSDPHPAVLDALAGVGGTGCKLFVMRGNRDFLVGDGFARHTGATLLEDYHAMVLDGRKTLLTHGDLLCTKDFQYQQFRRFVRDPANQSQFLSHSLKERRAIAAKTRTGTKASMLEKDDFIMDVEQSTVEQVMRRFDVTDLIHGHTHRPGAHEFELDGNLRRRFVLADWYDQDNVLVSEAGRLREHRIDEYLI
jgi:UDP-2,3-diacylglucosamine hydrolase